jgi:hypothetical protein
VSLISNWTSTASASVATLAIARFVADTLISVPVTLVGFSFAAVTSSSRTCDLDYVIVDGGDTNPLIARRITGRWRGIGAHACSHVECRAHYAIVIRSGGE